jgi:Kef-type K+ transport system membrane component KefB
VDEPVRVLSLLGLAFLLLLAGLEVDFDSLRGRLLQVSGAGFLVSLALALAVGAALDSAGVVRSGLLVAMFIPFFFVTSGLTFDGDALFSGASTLARVPLFLAALLVVRALPALLYVRLVGGRRSAAAGLLQATSLGFLVVAGRIGMDLGLLSAANGAALVAAGLLSVLLFPVAALTLLSTESARSETPAAAPAPPRA